MIITPWDGNPITAPGVISGVPMPIYHGPLVPTALGYSLSRSGIWTLFNESPAHFRATSCYNPDAVPFEETEPLLVGRGAHHLILGEADFARHFAIRPVEFDSWRTNAAKEWRDERRDAGFSVLEPKHIEIVRGMAGSLMAEPLIRAGILNGLIEHTMVARDPETGIWLKIRPDAIPGDSGDLSDFKTSADVSDEAIERAIADHGLFVQGALVRMVCRLLGVPFQTFTLVFVEKSPPYCVQIRTMKDADLDLGERVIRASLTAFVECMKRDFWPGPGGQRADAAYVEIPPWSRKRIEDKIMKLEALP